MPSIKTTYRSIPDGMILVSVLADLNIAMIVAPLDNGYQEFICLCSDEQWAAAMDREQQLFQSTLHIKREETEYERWRNSNGLAHKPVRGPGRRQMYA